MRIFFSEHQVVYDTYTFGWAVYCIPDSPNELHDVYARGFLPYSGMPELGASNLFYLARSVRVDLRTFTLAKNDLYVLRKIHPLNLTTRALPLSDALSSIPDLRIQIGQLAEPILGSGVMSAERIEYILMRDYLTEVVVFEGQDGIVNIALLVCGSDFTHVWYSLHPKWPNLGKYCLLKLVERAREQNHRYCYVGTGYTAHARYKTSLPGAEIFSGYEWSQDLTSLDDQWLLDNSTVVQKEDHFKQLRFPFLNRLPPG